MKKKLGTVGFWTALCIIMTLFAIMTVYEPGVAQRSHIQRTKPPRIAKTFSVTVTMSFDEITLEDASAMESKLLLYFETATDIDVRIANIITPDELHKGYGWEMLPDGTLVFPNMNLHPLFDPADSTMVIPKSLKPEIVLPENKI